MTLYNGMTVNERLFLSGRMDEFDALVRAKDVNGLKALLKDVEITDDSNVRAIIEQLGLEYMPRQKETRQAKRKWIKILLLLVPLSLVVLFWCTHEEDYVGTYTCKHKYGAEMVTLFPDHSFLQIYADSNGIDSNKGEWWVKSKNAFGLNLLFFDGWMTFKTPFQGEKAKELFGEGEKSIASFYIRSKCIIAEEDFPEFNPCKE